MEKCIPPNEKIVELRKAIQRAEKNDREQQVLKLEAELKALEQTLRGDATAEAVVDSSVEINEFDAVEEDAKNEVESIEYVYFDIESAREDVYQYSKQIAEYVQSEDVRNIVFADTSARPIWIGVHEYWRNVYTEDQKPGFYFINPEGLEARVTPTDILRDLLESVGVILFEENTSPTEKFAAQYVELMEEAGEPVLVFDTCAHTGKTIRSISRLLEQAGFTDIRIITVMKPDEDSGIESDAVLCTERHKETCYPFGMDGLVDKTNDITSEKSGSVANQKIGKMIRREIRRIVRERLDAEGSQKTK